MSPGSGGWRSKSPTTGLTEVTSMPRWAGIAAAWAIVRPWASKMAAEASSASFTIAEWAAFSSTTSISSAITSRRLRITSRVIGSTATGATAGSADIGGLPGRRRGLGGPNADDQVPGLVHAEALAGIDDGRRIRLLDDGRPDDLLAFDQRRAAVDRRRPVAADLVEVGRAVSDRLGRRAARQVGAHADRRERRRVDRPDGHQFDRTVGQREAVD